MALPVRRNEAEAARWDPFAELNRLNQQLQSYLDRWGEFPELAGGFTPPGPTWRRPTTPMWWRSSFRASSATTPPWRSPGDAQNLGFAIASDTLVPILEDLRRGGRGQARAFLGVATYPVDADVRERFGLEARQGALVVDVTAGSPADAAGLRPGDVITSLADRRVSSPEDLSAAVRAHRPGERVELRWQRGNEERSATVTLSQASR